MSRTALLLGFTVPQEYADRIFVLDPSPPVQTHNFAWSLTRSLCVVYDSVFLLSASPLQNFPIGRRILVWAHDFQVGEVRGHMIGFVNLLALKHLTRTVACLLSLPRIVWRWRVNDVFIHGVHSPFLLFGVLLRSLGCRVVPVLTDPPGVVNATDGRLSRILKTIDILLVRFLIRRNSAVVAVAPNLVQDYRDKMPVLVLPGILKESWIRKLHLARESAANQPVVKPPCRPYVVYAGGLFAAYGVDRLIAAAAMVPEVDVLLFGKGDQVEALENNTLPNVHYRGFVSADVLASVVQDAAMLINPRPSNAGFAIQSFPSKLIEYLATDRPVLTTRIHSIPAEIASCFHYIDDESPAGIASAIRHVLAHPDLPGLCGKSTSSITMDLYAEPIVGRKFAELLQNVHAN